MTRLNNITRIVNASKRCNAQGCFHNRRKGVTGYCQPHERARNLYGHPLGKFIRPRDYSAEKAEVTDFVEKYQEHPSITVTMKWLKGWLEDAQKGKAMQAAREIYRLADYGVTANDILIETAAIWLYATRFPNRLPDDERLTYALGIGMLSLAPLYNTYQYTNGVEKKRSKRVPGKARKLIGRQLRSELSILYMRIAERIQEEQAQKNSFRQTLASHPFD